MWRIFIWKISPSQTSSNFVLEILRVTRLSRRAYQQVDLRCGWWRTLIIRMADDADQCLTMPVKFDDAWWCLRCLMLVMHDPACNAWWCLRWCMTLGDKRRTKARRGQTETNRGQTQDGNTRGQTQDEDKREQQAIEIRILERNGFMHPNPSFCICFVLANIDF